MKKLCVLLCLFAFPALAGDLAETGDLAPITDLSTDPDLLKPREKPRDATDDLLRQMDSSGQTRAEQNTYQNQIDPSGAASTLTIPAGAIPGVQGAIVVPQTGG